MDSKKEHSREVKKRYVRTGSDKRSSQEVTDTLPPPPKPKRGSKKK